MHWVGVSGCDGNSQHWCGAFIDADIDVGRLRPCGGGARERRCHPRGASRIVIRAEIATMTKNPKTSAQKIELLCLFVISSLLIHPCSSCPVAGVHSSSWSAPCILSCKCAPFLVEGGISRHALAVAGSVFTLWPHQSELQRRGPLDLYHETPKFSWERECFQENGTTS